MNPRSSSSSDVPALVANVPALVADSQPALPSPIRTMHDMVALMEEHKIFVISDSVLTYSHDSSPLVFILWTPSRELPALLAPFFSRPLPVHPFNQASPHRQYILNYAALAALTGIVSNDDDFAYHHINAALSLTVWVLSEDAGFTLNPQTPGLPLATVLDFPQLRSDRRVPFDMQIERTLMGTQFGLHGSGARLTKDEATDFIASARKFKALPLGLRYVAALPNAMYAFFTLLLDDVCSRFRVVNPEDDPAWDFNDACLRLFPHSEDVFDDQFINQLLKPGTPFYCHIDLDNFEPVMALKLSVGEVRQSLLAEVHIRDLAQQRREVTAMAAMDQLAQTQPRHVSQTQTQRITHVAAAKNKQPCKQKQAAKEEVARMESELKADESQREQRETKERLAVVQRRIREIDENIAKDEAMIRSNNKRLEELKQEGEEAEQKIEEAERQIAEREAAQVINLQAYARSQAELAKAEFVFAMTMACEYKRKVVLRQCQETLAKLKAHRAEAQGAAEARANAEAQAAAERDAQAKAEAEEARAKAEAAALKEAQAKGAAATRAAADKEAAVEAARVKAAMRVAAFRAAAAKAGEEKAAEVKVTKTRTSNLKAKPAAVKAGEAKAKVATEKAKVRASAGKAAAPKPSWR